MSNGIAGENRLPEIIAQEYCDFLLEENEALKVKADLFDSLMECQRIRVLGFARRDKEGTEGPIEHIGVEFWRSFSEVDDKGDREILMEFLSKEANNDDR